MKLRIYKTSNTAGAYVDLEVYDAQVSRVLNGNDQITFKVDSEAALDLTIGSTLLVNVGENKTYHMNKLPVYEKLSSSLHAYSFTFEAPIFDLRRVALLNSLDESDFFFCGRMADFVDLIIYNTNRVNVTLANSFAAGTIPETEYKNLQFNNVNCWAALNMICDAYDYEFEVSFSVDTYLISLVKKIGNATGITLAYGKDAGLKNIKRVNVNTDDLITRLYYRGSNKNLPANYAYDRLRGTVNNVDQNVSLFGLSEKVHFFDEIKPEYQGTITSFSKEKNDWFMADTALPFNLIEKDGENYKYIIEGTSAKINMLTGDCAGYSFDIKKDTYNDSAKKWAVIMYKHEDGYEVPNDTVKPAVGDLYAITDIHMPDSYLVSAVANLNVEALAYLALHSTPRVQYDLQTDTVFSSINDIQLNLGDLVTINDTDLAITEDTRVVETSFPLFDRYKQSIKLSDVRFAIPRRKEQINNINIATAIKSGELNQAERILKSAKTTNELKNKVFDPIDEFFVPENNRPVSLDPYMLAQDSGEPQFSLTGVALVPNYNDNANTLQIVGGTITMHAVKAQKRSDIQKLIDAEIEYVPYKSYTVNAGFVALSAGSAYHIYAKVPLDKTATTAEIVTSITHLWAKSEVTINATTGAEEGYILHKLGYISSVGSDGKRTLTSLWTSVKGFAVDGLSAYEIAVSNGYEGTELEWLESLHGTDGEPGDPGDPAPDKYYTLTDTPAAPPATPERGFAIVTQAGEVQKHRHATALGEDENGPWFTAVPDVITYGTQIIPATTVTLANGWAISAENMLWHPDAGAWFSAGETPTGITGYVQIANISFVQGQNYEVYALLALDYRTTDHQVELQIIGAQSTSVVFSDLHLQQSRTMPYQHTLATGTYTVRISYSNFVTPYSGAFLHTLTITPYSITAGGAIRATDPSGQMLYRLPASTPEKGDAILVGDNGNLYFGKVNTIIPNFHPAAAVDDNSTTYATITPEQVFAFSEAVRNLFAALVSGTAGDILYHNGTTWVKLPKGTNGHVLKQATNAPEWAAESAGASQWTDDDYGINYQAGNVGIGTASDEDHALVISHTEGTGEAVQILSHAGEAIWAQALSADGVIGMTASATRWGGVFSGGRGLWASKLAVGGNATTPAFSFPDSDGSNGQVLATNGSGVLSWTTPSSGGGVPGTETLSGTSITISWNGNTSATINITAATTLTFGTPANYVKRLFVSGNYSLTLPASAEILSGEYDGTKVNIIDLIPAPGGTVYVTIN